MTSRIYSNATIATMDQTDDAAYGLIENAALVVEGEKIAWVGAQDALPDAYKDVPSQDLNGRLITPALIDCHTHVVHGGNRAKEYEMRLNGESYEAISKAGGGIVSTVSHTRACSQDELLAQALPRVDALIREGVSTIEIKSGYGLDEENELKMLRVARRIGVERPIRVKTSYLAAHATPQEYKGRDDAYIDEVVIPTLHKAYDEGLVDAVDGFCEGIAFSPAQIERVFIAAKTLGLPVKLHAEQLSNLHGAELAAKYGAMSADHLEHLDEAGVIAMAKSGTVAVLLPGAFYTLHETQYPPLQHLRNHKVPIAIATDCNPGSSPLASILLTMNMASTLFGMTCEESLLGATANAARALQLENCGTIEAGKCADLNIWNAENPAELVYRIGFNPLYKRIFKGRG